MSDSNYSYAMLRMMMMLDPTGGLNLYDFTIECRSEHPLVLSIQLLMTKRYLSMFTKNVTQN